jgi:hypothetical protein
MSFPQKAGSTLKLRKMGKISWKACFGQDWQVTDGHLKLGTQAKFWQLGDLQKMLDEAQKAEASSVSSSWQAPKSSFSYKLTARINEIKAEILWTLLVNDGKGYRSLLSSPFNDLELLLDVLELTLANELDVRVAPPQIPAPYPQQLGYPQALPPFIQQQPFPPQMPFNGGYPPANYQTYASQPSQPVVPERDERNTNIINPLSSATSVMPPGALMGINTDAKKPLVEPSRVRPNILLGKFLLEAHLIPQHTIDGALLLQDMVKSGALSVDVAAEALARAHNRSGAFDTSIFLAKPNPHARDMKISAPPMGELLLKAGLINEEALSAALTIQDAASKGQMTNEEALKDFAKRSFGSSTNHSMPAVQPTGQQGYEERAVQLLVTAKLIENQDLAAALKVQEKSGGYLLKILETASRIDEVLSAAALRAQSLVDQKKMKAEQVIIVLYYVQRSRVSFDDAIDEMGWEKP